MNKLTTITCGAGVPSRTARMMRCQNKWGKYRRARAMIWIG